MRGFDSSLFGYARKQNFVANTWFLKERENSLITRVAVGLPVRISIPESVSEARGAMLSSGAYLAGI